MLNYLQKIVELGTLLIKSSIKNLRQKITPHFFFAILPIPIIEGDDKYEKKETFKKGTRRSIMDRSYWRIINVLYIKRICNRRIVPLFFLSLFTKFVKIYLTLSGICYY